MDWESTVPHEHRSVLPEGFGASKSKFYRTLEEAMQTQGMIGGQEFPGEANIFCFLGKGELVKAEREGCEWCKLGFVDSESFPLSVG